MNGITQATKGLEGGDDRRWGRMDFKIEVLQIDEATRTVHFQAVPDPRRYDRVEKDGEVHYLDKYLRLLIPAKLILGKGAEMLSGLPVYHLSPSIRSTPDYAAARKAAIESELHAGTYVPPVEKALAHRSFEADPNAREIVFLSIDICGGSALRRANPTNFERAYTIFLRELGTITGHFAGRILKTTGDGFIAYIDHPSFTRRSDNAVDLGLSFLVVLRNSINPALNDVGLPELKIRVGADCGMATIRQIEVPATGFSTAEIASDALNRAVKIQEAAAVNEFRIGRDLYEQIHVQWLERAHEVEFDGTVVGATGYRTYRVT